MPASKKQKAWAARRRDFTRKWLKRYKNLLSCTDCGLSFKNKQYLCDFHHIDPHTKDGTIYSMGYHLPKIKEEIRKCIPLCSNCHRERHYGDSGRT